MTPSASQFLLSPKGREITASITGLSLDPLALGSRLRKKYPDIEPANLAAVTELAETRVKAANKFDRASDMFFTREALEQSTGEAVARHRAKRFQGLGHVLDACSGIGGDAIALAGMVDSLDCVDLDEGRLAFCGENCRIHGHENVGLIARDVGEMIRVAAGYDAVFIDPSRRKGERRSSGLHVMEPPLEVMEALLRAAPRGAAKLSPSVRLDPLSIAHETEWIATADGLKEAVIWTGDFIRCETTVTLLHKNITLRDSDLPAAEPSIANAQDYIHEPDAALIRSGLLGRKASSLGMSLVSSEIAYMSSDAATDDPFFTSYRIIESLPFNMKKLERLLNDRDIGRVTVKKRGFPMLPEEVKKKLKLRGKKEGIVILTKVKGNNTAFVVERV